MEIMNAETIMESIFDDVIMESTYRMLEFHDTLPVTEKPVLKEQWAEFLTSVIAITMDTTVQATVNHLNFQNTRYELDCGNDDQDDGNLYS